MLIFIVFYEILLFSTKFQRILMKIELSALTSACFMGVLILKLAENLKNKVLGQKTKKNKFLAEMLSKQ